MDSGDQVDIHVVSLDETYKEEKMVETLKQFLVKNEQQDLKNAIGALEMSMDYLNSMKKHLKKVDNKNVQNVVGKWLITLNKKIDDLYDDIEDVEAHLGMALEEM